LDQPIHFASADDVQAKARLDSVGGYEKVFPKALYYIISYTKNYAGVGPQSDNALLLALVQDRTPRQLMILGFSLRIVALELAVAGDEKSIAEEKPLVPETLFKDNEGLYRQRVKEWSGEIETFRFMTTELLKTLPNHSTEPTAASGTSAAGHPPRQP
jgi:hypothetical protein